MKLSSSEKATLHFYEWEYLTRGYYHFDEQVSIEPPFTPFYHKSFYDDNYTDDGRVPSLFKQINTLFNPPQEKEEEYILKPITPNKVKPTIASVGFSFSFQKGTEISSAISIEFLNALAFTENSVSFEIHATDSNITIQIVCCEEDRTRIESHLRAYFPTVIIHEINIYALDFDLKRTVTIADFGLNEECMRGIETAHSFSIDPLTSAIATLGNLQKGDTAMTQIIFQGVTAPWSKSIINAVSDGMGGSFFADAPDMLSCGKEKVSSPLFSAVVRIATQGNTEARSEYLATELSRTITSISTSKYNKLIPLSNEGYAYDNHIRNVYERRSNRLGMLLNSNELALFVHYPNRSVVSQKLGRQDGKTKALPPEAINQKYNIGINEHNGVRTSVTISDEARLKHTHIIGATGVGKSTLIARMVLNDMKLGNGCVLFDPHGDIVEDILLRVPSHRADDVIIIDPSDSEFSIGFNLLSAKTEIEKMVLSSDLVSVFKRHATAWGDNMTAVLSNAINTFLDSSVGGTIIELKRFLIEDNFRKSFLESVDDPSIHYYWEHEYYMVKKGITPLLTRIDTFLRPKIVRSMLAQTSGIDFRGCIEEKKIVLIKLAQGLIGVENSYLLGSLFLSKFNQAAQGRQSLPKEQRHPYYIYLDEFQNFITPSITSILSGARKYGLGLVLAHQELGQIDEPKILNSVISNPYMRICFRLGDNDARKLESGFSYFEQNDLQSLSTGQAIMRIGSSNNDFNISTFILDEVKDEGEAIRESIIVNTRAKYAKPKAEIEELLRSILPRVSQKIKKTVKEGPKQKEPLARPTPIIPKPKTEEQTEASTPATKDFEQKKNDYLKQAGEQEFIRKHRSVQNYVRTMSRQRGFKATLEEPTKSGGRVDVALLKDDIRIAVEISVTNTVDYEVKNIQKCIDDDYSLVFMVSDNQKHLANIRREALKIIDKKHHKIIHFFQSQDLSIYLEATEPKTKITEKRVRGYRVKVRYQSDNDSVGKQKSITDIIMKALRENK